jgi:hypothetical protein
VFRDTAFYRLGSRFGLARLLNSCIKEGGRESLGVYIPLSVV